MKLKYVSCEECGCVVSSDEALQNHKQIRHIGLKLPACACCAQIFQNLTALNQHYQRKHPEFQRDWLIKQQDR